MKKKSTIKQPIAAASPVLYGGPTIPGICHQFTVFADGNLPLAVLRIIEEKPMLKELIVPAEQFSRLKAALQDSSSPESIIFDKLTRR